MKYRFGHIWSEKDFTNMGWNSSRLYGLLLPGRNHKLTLMLDYVLQRPKSGISDLKQWELIPVNLIYENVVDLEIKITMSKYTEIDIIDVSRSNERLTPNGKMTYWDYYIELSSDNFLQFTATNFTQRAIANPVVTKNSDLNREGDFLKS